MSLIIGYRSNYKPVAVVAVLERQRGGRARRLSGKDLAKVSRGMVGLDGRAVLAVSDSAMALENSAKIRK
jgi:hypothetical protein